MILDENFKKRQQAIMESCPDIDMHTQMLCENECRRQLEALRHDLGVVLNMFSQSEYLNNRLLDPIREMLHTIESYELPIINREYIDGNDPYVTQQGNEQRRIIMHMMEPVIRKYVYQEEK